MNEILVPTGLAELVDQIIILQGKVQATTTPAARSLLAQRLNLMQRVAARVLPQDPLVDPLRQAVVSARHDLIQLEADLRACEARCDFGVAFVALARAYLDAQATLDATKLALDAHAARSVTACDAAEIRHSRPFGGLSHFD